MTTNIAEKVRELIGRNTQDTKEEAMSIFIRAALARVNERRNEKDPLGFQTEESYRPKHALALHNTPGNRAVHWTGGHTSVAECTVWLTVDDGPRTESLTQVSLGMHDFYFNGTKISLDAPDVIDVAAVTISKYIDSRPPKGH